MQRAPGSEEELEERLSRPSPEVLAALSQAPGDILVLGAGGKMGPSLTAMARRAVDELGDGRRVVAVSRWSDAAQVSRLAGMGVEVVRSDLLDVQGYASLPDAANVIYMAGQKFGTTTAPGLTWMTNVVVPALAAARYAGARFVAFSTGNVYPLVAVEGERGGSREDDALAATGDYAASCVGRERVLDFASRERGTPMAIIRLNYAVDLRYGVIVDIAQKVLEGVPVDLGMGWVNCIWQGDANAIALRALPHCATPPFVVNVTGPERLAVRDVAHTLGRLLERDVQLGGGEGGDALLSDTTRMQALFGAPSVGAEELVTWVAEWLRHGGRTLGKRTRFEVRGGAY